MYIDTKKCLSLISACEIKFKLIIDSNARITVIEF